MEKIRIGNSVVGGIVGLVCTKNFDMNITNCYNSGNINAPYYMAGGLVGNNYLTGSKYLIINNCYNVGSITAPSHRGELMGWVSGTKFTFCYCLRTPEYGSWYQSTANNSGLISESNLKNIPSAFQSNYKVDSNGINKGFPILKWQ